MTPFLLQTSWWVPFYGLVGAIVALPWAIGVVRRTGPRPAAYFNLLMTFLALVHSWLLFQDTWTNPNQHVLIHWFQAADLDLSFALEISPVSMGVTVMVTGFSLLAQLYGLGYLEKDWALGRFYGLMGFFEAAMSGLALSDSLLLSYCLLEMLTLSTYLLVGFWYAQPLVVTAARDAFLTKRVGDMLLLMGVVALSTLAGSLNFSDLDTWAATADLAPLTANLLGLALIAGPLGKCAQFPLHLWLDEAMEGPNPASIMRNSMVVACGAYVLIKLQPVVVLSPLAVDTLIALGSLTAIGASLVSLAQIDIKRALSHSTSAYLGLVFIAVGMQQTHLALMLLFVHAIAKVMLFMSIGSVILTTSTQDLTEMGGLGKRMPATTITFALGMVSLVGLLPFGTFWGMQRWIDQFWEHAPALVGLMLVVNALTALNLVRVFRLIFLGQPQPKTRRAPEVPWTMAVPMVSGIVVSLLVPLMFWQWQLLPQWQDLNWTTNLMLLGSTVLGGIIGSLIHLERNWSRSIRLFWKFWQDILAYDFYIDRLYRISVVQAVTLLSRVSNWLDRYVVDGFVNLVGLATLMGGQSLKYSIPGQSQLYVLTIFVGVSLLGVFLSWIF